MAVPRVLLENEWEKSHLYYFWTLNGAASLSSVATTTSRTSLKTSGKGEFGQLYFGCLGRMVWKYSSPKVGIGRKNFQRPSRLF